MTWQNLIHDFFLFAFLAYVVKQVSNHVSFKLIVRGDEIEVLHFILIMVGIALFGVTVYLWM